MDDAYEEYGCPDCMCCMNCVDDPDCPTDRLGDSACPCTCY